MNILLTLLVLAAPPKQPQVFYYDGRNLVKPDRIEMPNAGHAVMQFFVHSPYELRGASIDSSDVSVCLPDYSLRKSLKLRGRWYTITWDARLTVGSRRHILVINSYRGQTYRESFFVNVEGTKRMEKPQGVN
jgi:hypothetical protein